MGDIKHYGPVDYGLPQQLHRIEERRMNEVNIVFPSRPGFEYNYLRQES